MSNLIEFSGVYICKGEEMAIQIALQMPEQDPSSGDYFCGVLSNQLFTRRMKVYGVSRAQAIRLALTIVQEALTSLLLTEDELADDVLEDL